MKFSYNWLRRLAPTEKSPEELAEMITFQGLNVEEMTYLGRDVPSGLVMAKILDVVHRSDGLGVCEIDVGDGKRTVVSRAPNVREGIFVPYAAAGITMPNGERVERREFGDVVSSGILCSAAEIGIPGGPSEYLLEVDSARPGSDAFEVLGLDDWTFDLDLTPNYATHCQSVVGIGREVDAVEDCGLEIPPGYMAPNGSGTLADIDVRDTDLCPRYTAIVLENVRVGPSPWWIQRDLLASGIRPINNVVDVTNYVMLETGQPLHAFDLDRLEGDTVVIRRARPGERLKTIDGHDRQLDSEDLVISDAGKAIGLAGIMGGENSEITQDTERVFLESAHFRATTVLKSSRRLALQTDASLRFEKGADPEATVRAAARTVEILTSIAKETECGPLNDHYPEPIRPTDLQLDSEWINRLLGTQINAPQMRGYLRRLGFGMDPSGTRVVVPSWRADVSLPVDLSEEIARMHGYNRIRSSLPLTEIHGYVPDRRSFAEDAAVEYMVGAGFYEIVTRSWMPTKYLEILGSPEGHPYRHLVPISNPMREDQSHLRSTLLADALQTLAASHGTFEGKRVFEIARVYIPRELPPKTLPEEPLRMCIAAEGRVRGEHWGHREAPEMDFYYVKGVVEGLLRVLGVDDCEFVPSDAHYLCPGRGARLLVGGSIAGDFGELHPDVLRRADLDAPVVIGELDFEVLAENARSGAKVSPMPAFPSSHRDIAVVVSEDVTHLQVLDSVRRWAGDLLEEVRLFDIYRGDPIPENSKSMAYHLIYRATDRTLTDAEVERRQESVIWGLQEDLGAELRS
ncbi:MAG: phenylalanine--tRNA ligase subunit beta [Bacillota bacterium]